MKFFLSLTLLLVTFSVGCKPSSRPSLPAIPAPVPAPKVNTTTNVFFSIGSDCTNTNTATFSPGGAPLVVSLCVNSTSPTSLCGGTYKLQTQHPQEDGHFNIVALTPPAQFPDPNNESYNLPIAITSTDSQADLGSTAVLPGRSIPVVNSTLLMSFTIAPQSLAQNSSYTINLSPISSLAVDSNDINNSSCRLPQEVTIEASFTLRKN